MFLKDCILPWAGEERNGEQFINGCGVSFWADEYALELDSSDGCITL